jgi:hypothetical protein
VCLKPHRAQSPLSMTALSPSASIGLRRPQCLSSIGTRFDRGHTSRQPSARMGLPPSRHEIRPTVTGPARLLGTNYRCSVQSRCNRASFMHPPQLTPTFDCHPVAWRNSRGWLPEGPTSTMSGRNGACLSCNSRLSLPSMSSLQRCWASILSTLPEIDSV